MAEYIEKQKAVDLLIELEKEFQQFKPFNGFEHAMYRKLSEAKIAIEKLPAADVVPVLRCKDCKHLRVWNRKDIYAFCPKTNIVFLPFELDTRTFFCSLGERKPSTDG